MSRWCSFEQSLYLCGLDPFEYSGPQIQGLGAGNSTGSLISLKIELLFVIAFCAITFLDPSHRVENPRL